MVINGFDHELYDYEENLPSKVKLTQGLPERYNEFIFGEPVATVGSTYCIWTDDNNQWATGIIDYENDGSEDHLSIFDDNPTTYLEWAIDYFFDGEEEAAPDSFIELIKDIYQEKVLTKEIVITLNPELEDWELLKEDIDSIGYPTNF